MRKPYAWFGSIKTVPAEVSAEAGSINKEKKK